MNTGKAIKHFRSEKKLSQRDLAAKANISTTSLCLIETGKTRPNESTLKKICLVLGIPESVLYILSLDENDVPAERRDIFKLLYPSITALTMKIIEEDSPVSRG